MFRRSRALFFFGDPEDAAKLQLNEYLNRVGPALPDVDFEEMEEQDLRNVMAYIYGALRGAIRDDMDEAVVDVLRNWYDEVFVVLAGSSESFRENVLKGFVQPPGGRPERKRYRELARKASES